MTSIIIFIIILAILILVHEFGHFLLARLFRIRVDEFGLGYPPRALTLFERKGTRFTLNWLPFGGFVKIFGENGEGADLSQPGAEDSFVQKPRYAQALVLVAGVTFNIIFAWLIISAGFMMGLPTSTSTDAGQVTDPKLVITMVAPGSPADKAGVHAGDVIHTLSAGSDMIENPAPEAVSDFISSHGDNEVKLAISRGEENKEISVHPEAGIIADQKAIGISMDMIGTLTLPIHKARWEGGKTTISLTKVIAVGLVEFVYNSVRGASHLSQLTGPVGIVGLVGDATQLGFVYLISFTAFISINLAVINLIPFPALDGGRLLFVLIEAIKRKPISPKIANSLNAVGFVLLILLMIFVTIQDVLKLI